MRISVLKVMGVLVGAAAFLSGCAPTTVEKKEGMLVWPLPPDEPRVVYLNSYYGESNFKKKGFIENVLGESLLTKELQKPYGVTAYANSLYVTDTQGGVVYVFDFAQQKVSFLGDKGAGKLALPAGVAVDADGTVFVSDAKQKRVVGFDATGAVKVAFGKKNEFENPAGLAVNRELGRLYVVDSFGHQVKMFSTKGEYLGTFGKRGEAEGDFNYPSNIVVDRRNGNLLVVDTQNFRVQVFTKDGVFVKKFGQIGDYPGTFSRPKGIGIDSEGHVYVVDAAFDNFQIFDQDGKPLLFIGGAGTEPGFFWLPAGMYIDEKDRIYIVDSFNRRVQVFQYLSEQWKKANPGEYRKYQQK